MRQGWQEKPTRVETWRAIASTPDSTPTRRTACALCISAQILQGVSRVVGRGSLSQADAKSAAAPTLSKFRCTKGLERRFSIGEFLGTRARIWPCVQSIPRNGAATASC